MQCHGSYLVLIPLQNLNFDLIGKYLQGNDVTEEYDEKIYWNGIDFVEKK